MIVEEEGVCLLVDLNADSVDKGVQKGMTMVKLQGCVLRQA